MRIETTQRISSTGTARRRSGAAGGGSFSVSVPEEKSASQGVGASTSLSGIEALMTLQEVDEADVRKRRALKRGHDLLDLLETVRLDMIGGIDNPAVLKRLSDLARRQRDIADDPRLAGVLEEIELRAAVELAKRGMIPA